MTSHASSIRSSPLLLAPTGVEERWVVIAGSDSKWLVIGGSNDEWFMRKMFGGCEKEDGGVWG